MSQPKMANPDQQSLLNPDLLDQLNPKHPLMQLAWRIEWSSFEDEFGVLLPSIPIEANPQNLYA